MGKKQFIVALCLGAGITLLVERISRRHPRILQTATPNQILQRVANVPIYRWSYRWRPHIAHLGPVAQQFYAAFQVGGNPRTLNLLDVTGVLLASVQALYAHVQELQSQRVPSSPPGHSPNHPSGESPDLIGS